MTLYKTPGVYIEERNASPYSITPAETANPAFIGYTQNTIYNEEDLIGKPIEIDSLAEYERIFCERDSKHYQPNYFLKKIATTPISEIKISLLNGEYYLLPDVSSIYYLHNCIRLFFANGGNKAYIVSTGKYKQMLDEAKVIGAPLVNPNIKLNELLAGLKSIKDNNKITLYVCPDSSLMNAKEHGLMQQAMLKQSGESKATFCILDVKDNYHDSPNIHEADINLFRSHVGIEHLSFGAAYYPFLKCNIINQEEIDYNNLSNESKKDIIETNKIKVDSIEIFKKFANANTNDKLKKLHQEALLNSTDYKLIIKAIADQINILSPSSAIAGIYTFKDKTQGVWNAPANVGVQATKGLTIQLDTSQQAKLNTDSIAGKSINAIRFFAGSGILAWGARTLDGNSNEWKYIPIRRLLIMIEQSITNALESYIFEPNTIVTWQKVKTRIDDYLTNIWKQGGLQGAKPSDSFFTNIGLSSSMTSADIQNGIMIVTIGVAPTRPAEFIILSFRQKMQMA